MVAAPALSAPAAAHDPPLRRNTDSAAAGRQPSFASAAPGRCATRWLLGVSCARLGSEQALPPLSGGRSWPCSELPQGFGFSSQRVAAARPLPGVAPRTAAAWPWGRAAPETGAPAGNAGPDAREPGGATSGGGGAGRRGPSAVSLKELLSPAPSHDGGADGGRGEGQAATTWLPPPPHAPRPRAIHNPASLAFLGDGIYELYARRHFLLPPQTLDRYNASVTAVVRCEAQDLLLQGLLRDGTLSAEERDIVRWGRNATGTGTRKARGRAGGAVYSSATALETLIGYLYVTDPPRLEAVMRELGFGCFGAPLAQAREMVSAPSPAGGPSQTAERDPSL